MITVIADLSQIDNFEELGEITLEADSTEYFAIDANKEFLKVCLQRNEI